MASGSLPTPSSDPTESADTLPACTSPSGEGCTPVGPHAMAAALARPICKKRRLHVEQLMRRSST